ncbi:methyltransferase domain-containing protein [Bacillus mycoides]|uniref:class I SAM-dependent methyltransferase n=1 Tax=Bacillus mycoides TaxID=1405 RepID=UPI001C00B037|nr:class I SAM-dependent methyltransferase [Bacillus mycoides]QWG47496.1 methyltransferase domain-containing protein [Bacillus mycoides]
MGKALTYMTEVNDEEKEEKKFDGFDNRISWIYKNTIGGKVLDIDCSQGIVSTLLGREGKQVLGIDVSREAINSARKILQKESNRTKKHVEFKVVKFLDYRFNKRKYDCIIMNRIFKNGMDPHKFIKKALRLLNNQGRIIITVPFGVNGSLNNEEAYYLMDVFKLPVEGAVITEIEFIGDSLGVVIKKASEAEYELSLNKELIMKLEENFYNMECSYTEKLITKQQYIEKIEKERNGFDNVQKELRDFKSLNDDLQKENQMLRKQLGQQRDFHKTFSSSLEEKINKINELNEILQKQDEKLLEKDASLIEIKKQLVHKDIIVTALNKTVVEKGKENRAFQQAIKGQGLQHKALNEKFVEANRGLEQYRDIILEKKEATIESREQTVKIQEELLEAYKKEEKLLKSYQKLLNEHKKISNRHDALSHSKLGKVTLSYWQWRKKGFGGKKFE